MRQTWQCDYCGEVFLTKEEAAEQVMNEFHDELIWYFTKFQSRMD